MGYTPKDVKEKLGRLQKCARRTVRKVKSFALCKPKPSQRQTTADDAILKQGTPLKRPETYIPTGAPWIRTLSESKDTRHASGRQSSIDPETMPPSRHDGNEAVQIQTAEESVEERYTSGSPRMIMAHHDNERCIALLPNQELIQQLQRAVLEKRAVSKAKEDAGTKIGDLDNTLEGFRLAAEEVEDEIAELEQSEDVSSQGQIEKLRRKLARLQRKEQAATQDRQACIQTLETDYRNQRYNVHLLLSSFEQVLMSSQLISSDVDEANILGEDEEGASEGLQVEGPSLNGCVSSSGSDTSSSCAFDAADVDETPESAEAQSLINHFRSMRMRLGVMEDALENRDTMFEHQAEDRQRRKQAGEEVESSLAFDMGQLKTTRALTRQVRDAEEAYQAAKDVAMAAGVQVPGSEISSGFVDDVNDGYRISSENDYAATVDRSLILRWLSDIPEEDTDELHEVERDDWDAQSVEMCDSWSMVADGSTRRRIDKWRGLSIACT